MATITKFAIEDEKPFKNVTSNCNIKFLKNSVRFTRFRFTLRFT